MAGLLVAIAIVMWLAYMWNKSGETECRQCGTKIHHSDKGTHKYWGNPGYYGCLMTHTLCKRCGTIHNQEVDCQKKTRQANYRKKHGM